MSRLVARMPRASAGTPPSITCAPRNTSPSSVTIDPRSGPLGPAEAASLSARDAALAASKSAAIQARARTD